MGKTRKNKIKDSRPVPEIKIISINKEGYSSINVEYK
jgi:hypothetical protein